MILVGLSETAALQYIGTLPTGPSDLTIACINSGNNVTVSGSEDSIDCLKGLLDVDGVFAQKLLVDVAYHSSHMNQNRNRVSPIYPGPGDRKDVNRKAIHGFFRDRHAGIYD